MSKKRTMRRRKTSPEYVKNGKTILESVNEFLDDEMKNIKSKIDAKVGARFTDTNIRMVSWDITQINANLFLIGIAKMDDKNYGAFYTHNHQPLNPEGYIKKLQLTPSTLKMKGS